METRGAHRSSTLTLDPDGAFYRTPPADHRPPDHRAPDHRPNTARTPLGVSPAGEGIRLLNQPPPKRRDRGSTM
ncbi:unnamed protein product [Boreogadus saida]